jgi:predicted AlkP superfamily phosphohydrolase/phosphomutase
MRTLLIALDGATFRILDPLLAEGVMPCLAGLVRAGARGELLSTPNPLTPPAFTSMTTGRGPGHHGVYDFIRATERDGSLYFTLINARDVRCETVWSIASRGGRTVTALNFIAMYPPPRVDGYVVPGFVTSRHLKHSVHPPALYAELKALATFDVREASWDVDQGRKPLLQGLGEEEYQEGVDYQRRKERQWFGVARHLMQAHPCDLTAVVFDGVDKLQHLMWPFIDPGCFGASPTPFEQRMRELCKQYFRDLDGYLAALVDLAGPEARVLVVSDHGFGPTDEIFYVNAWLAERGYLVWRAGTPADDSESLTAPDLKRHYASIDWSRTTAYARTASSNGIHIRVAAGPGHPGVAPADYAHFRARLVDDLERYRDPATGTPVVRRVLLREEAFPGPHTTLAPDLTLVLRDGGFASILKASTPLRQRSAVAGTHRPEGILIAAGAGIRPAPALLSPMSIVDVTPTLLYSLGLPVPADLEGRVLEDIFEPEVLRAAPVRSGPPTTGSAGADEAAIGDMTAGEEAQVLERLKALGYV